MINRPLLSRCAARPLLAAFAAMSLGLASAGAQTTVRGLPPLVSPPTAERHVGKVIWHELTTADLAAAKVFYGTLFGWTFEDISGLGTAYAVARKDGQPIAGLVAGPLTGEHQQPVWLPYFSVRDVDAARQDALSHGARAKTVTKSYAHRGRQTLLADPDGVAFGLMASSSGDPRDELALPGEWIWSSLLARHVEADVAFYQRLFGFEAFELEPSEGAEHAILASEDLARASVNSLLADAQRRQPHWLGFLRVDDVERVARQATILGGRVIVEPRLDRHGSPMAVLQDPSGAPVGIMEWVVGDSPGQAK